MRCLRSGAAVLLLLTLPVVARDRRNDLPAGWPWDTLPQIADGAHWKTSIVLVNLKERTGTYTLSFHADDGSALRFPLAGRGLRSSLSGSIPGHSSVVIQTDGTSATLTQGWAEVLVDDPDSNIGSMAIFGTRGVPGRPDFEATVPASTAVDYNCTLPFDNTGGFVTSLAVVNPMSSLSSTVAVFVRDESGQVLASESLALAAGQKLAFTSIDRWPTTRGKRGTVVFDSPTIQSLSVLGLRFNPGGAFTTIVPMDR